MDADFQLVKGVVEIVVVAADELALELPAAAELLGEDAQAAHLVLDLQADAGVERVEAIPLDGDRVILGILFQLEGIRSDKN